MTNKLDIDDGVEIKTEQMSKTSKEHIIQEVITQVETQEDTTEIRKQYDEVEFNQILIRGDG